METLKTLLKKHPEWKDLPIVVYRKDGLYDYVGENGSAYEGNDYSENERKVLVFSAN